MAAVFANFLIFNVEISFLLSDESGRMLVAVRSSGLRLLASSESVWEITPCGLLYQALHIGCRLAGLSYIMIRCYGLKTTPAASATR